MENSFLLGCVILLQIVSIVLLLLILLRPKKPPRHTNRSVPQNYPDVETGMLPLVNLNANINDDNFPQELEIDHSRLETIRMIESGGFFRGNLARLLQSADKTQWMNVYVKSVNSIYDVSQRTYLNAELKELSEMSKHPNVLAMVGFVKLKRGISIVYEYMEGGDLQTFVKKFKSNGFLNQLEPASTGQFYNTEANSALDSDMNSLSTMDLLSFAYQICNGLQFLSEHSDIHPYLALRKILIAKNKTIRISDFSLEKRLNEKQYYRLIPPAMTDPSCYCSPEALDGTEARVTIKSDVWAFAVCLQELFTLGEKVYESVPVVYHFLKQGGRLAQPEFCHDDIYKLMLKCWNMDPSSRPTVSNCLEFFKEHFESHSLKILDQIESKLRDASEFQKELGEWV